MEYVTKAQCGGKFWKAGAKMQNKLEWDLMMLEEPEGHRYIQDGDSHERENNGVHGATNTWHNCHQ